ncbi:MAG: PilZ domain-containing protein [Deltaproteobacteria bacterium]|jgi:hypothetical protein|nr:PilZ domain-containing protein [Deltaproteobacteria bacterium]
MDNRRFKRFPCQLQLRFQLCQTGGRMVGPYQGRTINFSAGGLLLTTSCPLLRFGHLIAIKFIQGGLPSPPAEYFARVIRVKHLETPLPRQLYRVAADFRFINEARRAEIVAFLNRCLLNR